MQNCKDKICYVDIKKIKNGLLTETEDVVVNETSFILSCQCETLGMFTCTPAYMEELVTGYLVNSGIVNENNKLIHIEYIKGKRKYDVTLEDNKYFKKHPARTIRPTGCAGGEMVVVDSPVKKRRSNKLRIPAWQISALMAGFNKESLLFKTTGGVHSAAIADAKGILVFREDIGRHNAIDKVVGYMHIHKLGIKDKILLSSGRVSSEILLKAVYAGFGIVISHSAPTYKAIELAQKYNITLIGFARGQNFNIYTFPEKVLFDITG